MDVLIRSLWIALNTAVVMVTCFTLPQGSTTIEIEPKGYAFPVEGTKFSISCIIDTTLGTAYNGEFRRNDNSGITNSTDGHRVITRTNNGSKRILTLTWHPLKLSDRSEVEELNCVFGSQSHSYNIIILPEKAKPIIKMGKEKSINLIQNEDIDLHCTVNSAILDNVKDVSIQWRFGDEVGRDLGNTTNQGTIITQTSTRNGLKITVNSQLKLRNADKKHSGKYHCAVMMEFAENSLPPTTHVEYDTVNVNVITPTKSPDSVTSLSAGVLIQTMELWVLIVTIVIGLLFR